MLMYLIIDQYSGMLTSSYVTNNAFTHVVVLQRISLDLSAYDKRVFAKK